MSGFTIEGGVQLLNGISFVLGVAEGVAPGGLSDTGSGQLTATALTNELGDTLATESGLELTIG